jgi:undecaprenyl-diphosphatase
VTTFGLWLLARPYADFRWKLACASALASAGVALAANQLIADLWTRPRPYMAHPALTHLLTAPSPDPSFPSDHAAAAFAIAVAVLAFSRRLGAVMLGLAVAVSLSRVALGAHYPSDVAAGALVGSTAALLVTRFGRPWLLAMVSLLSRLTDPLLAHAWRRLP